MRLNRLRLRHFRAHRDAEFLFGPVLNVLVGPNGRGKTNVLEAIHVLCLSRSFLGLEDRHLVQFGRPFFELEGFLESDQGLAWTIRVFYEPESGKRFWLNQAPLERAADLVGRFPVVVLAPQDRDLTAGGPETRRRFLDNVISQASPLYLEDLLAYRRALRQRNALLWKHRQERQSAWLEVLEPWNYALVHYGSRLLWRRMRFLEAFQDLLRRAYEEVAEVSEEPRLVYRPSFEVAPVAGPEAIAERFHEALKEAWPLERRRARTLVGPHLDEVVFYLDGVELRRYASQGQHRSFVLALKWAQYAYLQEVLMERPLLLLDDVLSDLDARRAQAFLEVLRSGRFGQVFLTTTEADLFRQAHPNVRLLEIAAPSCMDLGVGHGQPPLAGTSA
ncbi:MAG: DNA replication and repair protein RecF [Bacteroidota bacterium]|nr:DNA replication and repair protein RecF [Bacteroidota bacterium]MDW8137427.1 DNA replication and repair protein RecF [Bacteroidota bacterium]